MKRTGVLGACLAAGVLVACSTHHDAPAPDATSTVSVPGVGSSAPEATKASAPASAVTPTAGSSTALASEAQRVYRTYNDQMTLLQRRGGASSLPQRLTEVLADPALAQTAALVKQVNASHLHLASSPDPSARVSVSAKPKTGALITLEACADGRAVAVLDASGKRVRSGLLMHETVSLKRVGGSLRIFDIDDRTVTTCNVA